MLKSSIVKKSGALRAMLLAGAMAVPSMALAGEVTLKSSDGTVNLVGEFVSFEDNSYVIRTGLGELRVSAERVRCEGADCPEFDVATADVVIAGSDTLGLGMMPLLLQGWAAYQDADAVLTSTAQKGEVLAELVGDQGFGDPMGSYLVSATVSSDAFRKLLDGSTEIGMASRRIRPAEARALRDSGAGNMVSANQEHIVAVDSLVVIVHPDNPVSTLRMDQLAGIYSGQIKNWSEVGGPDAPISLFDRSQGSGTRAVMANAIFGENRDLAPNAQVMNDNSEMASAVNNDPNAIGFVGYAFQRGAKAVSLVNECGLTMTPDSFSARTEEYALQRRLYLYTRADTLSDSAQALLDYAKSDEADEVIQKAGFIGLGIDKRPQPLNGDRARMLLDPTVDAFEGGVMREMLGKMVDYDRLSSTFRFTTGSSRLDERARLDMARLASYLKRKPDGTKVLFVGFTDDVGAFQSNRELSKRRAEQVMDELLAVAGDGLNGLELDSTGYGEIAPSACNLSEEGRRINRRVEVWVSQTDNL